MECLNCGKGNPEDSGFCGYCGKRQEVTITVDTLSVSKDSKHTPQSQITPPENNLLPINEPHPTPIEETKKCPYCAETIRLEAVVCRYCGMDLVKGVHVLEGSKESSVSLSQKPKENLSGDNIGVAFLFPIIGFIIGISYLTKPESKERGLLLILVTFVIMIIYISILSIVGLLFRI